MSESPPVAGPMPGPGRTPMALQAENPRVRLAPLVASRLSVRIGR
jgi:hypothetical protein